MSETAIFRDFTKKRREIFFTIDEERFDCRKALGAADLQQAMLKFKSARSDDEDVTAENVLAKISAALELLLLPDAHARFMAAVLDRDRLEPIDLPQLTEIFQWLIEQYTVRPTQALSESSTLSSIDNAGIGFLDGALPLDSTPLP